MARGTAKGTSRRNKGMSYTKWGYIFVAPFCIVYLIFSLYPLISTFIYSTANMKANTAEFWGFSDKEVYYDRYLDLTALYTDKDTFAERTGVDLTSYKRLRDYFDKFQKNADSYQPLKESGIKAIVDYANNPSDNDEFVYSKEAAAAVQSAYDNQDFGLLLPYYNELINWSSNYKNETVLNRNTVSLLMTKTDAIVNAEDSSEEGEETTAITPESIIESDKFIEFVDSLDTTEFNAGQTALLNYLSDYVSEQLGKDYTIPEFFKAVQSGDISLDDPTVYYVCYRLDKTNIDFTPEGSDEKISSKIAVSFLGDLEKYLTANVWKESINSLSSSSSWEAYSIGDKDLHDDEQQLLADMKTINAMGIADLEPLVKDGDAIKPSEDYLENKIVAFQQYIDKKYVANETATLAAMQVASIKNFRDATTDGDPVAKFEALDINIYGMISYKGEVDIQKYNEVKAKLGLTECLSMKAYEQIDASRKAENVEKGKALLEEQNALLPDAQAAYDAVKNSGDKKEVQSALESLRAVEVKIEKAHDMIDNPDGILSKVAAKDYYILTGFENFSQIFGNRSRLNTVVGAFVTTATMWLIGFAPQILLALLLSAWFTDTKIKLKGLGLMKALMYLPNVITSVTIAIFFRRLFIYSSGGSLSASQIILRACGMENGYNFFESGWATRFIICFINFWMWYGNTMITLIAGISSISTSLYEAAQIDGADSFQTYTKITMPLLRPMLLYTLVTSLIGGLQMFDIPQNINRSPALMNFNGTMIQSTRTVMMYINTQAFGTQQNKQVGIASAISVLLFISTTILSIIIFYLMRDKDAAKAKKLKKQGGKK